MRASIGAAEVDRLAPGDEPGEHVCAQTTEGKRADVEANACPICLEPISVLDRAVLSCGHAFCFGCIDQYCSGRCGRAGVGVPQRTIHRFHPCPCCRKTVLIPESPAAATLRMRLAGAQSTEDNGERAVIGRALIGEVAGIRADVETARRPGETVHDAAIRQGLSRQREARHARLAADSINTRTRTTRLPPATVAERTDSVRELRQAAGRNVAIRFCPTCQAPSIKTGGCDNVTCACGARFKWSAARPLHPCAHCHCNRGRFLSATTCQFCSKRARVEACARRAVGTLIAVPATAAGAAVVIAAAAAGVTLALLPAAVFSGPAALYEPIRRYRKQKHNYLAYAAASGAIVAGVCVTECAGYESD
jgi:hypothetical protein